eukprot:CAMPEP_0168564898 /NCGR_PEP_ID=MMETSP0413-20121227/13508_1 /TAXON_ID=136452 /ORGANISM="Filamoeba nolandi, Strain NC-AS-23-1" /LENGTH=150 /DNA_ID=CAMNT_0008596635 /DNA_START=35 /DNA_END=484 /DNA_ORIENTATION=+
MQPNFYSIPLHLPASVTVDPDVFMTSMSLEIPSTYFFLEAQPELYQRKSYPHSKRKEIRHFKPEVLRLLPNETSKKMIQDGVAVMRIVNEAMEPIEDEQPEIHELEQHTKTFDFHPIAHKTSKGKYYRLQFTINFVLESGEQKTEIITSD